MRADFEITEAERFLGYGIMDGKKHPFVVRAGLTLDVLEKIGVKSRDAVADHVAILHRADLRPGPTQLAAGVLDHSR